MNQTANLKLKKPELNDVANITELNSNWDILDKLAGESGSFGPPDYSSTIRILPPYTAPSNGFIIVCAQKWDVTVEINSHKFGIGSISSEYPTAVGFFIVKKGDFAFIRHYNNVVYFIPCI